MASKGLALVVTVAFVVVAVLVGTAGVDAQSGKIPRIGVLAVVPPTQESRQARLRDALREVGYIEGQNILAEYRSVAAGQADRLNDFAAELVRLKVDVIVAFSTPSVQAAQRATPDIPIVMVAGAFDAGLVTSLARPGGNVTGVAIIAAELGGKHLDLLRQILPRLTRVAVMAHATDPFARPFQEHIQSAARSVNVRIQPVIVRGAEDFDAAFDTMVRERAGAVIIQPILASTHAAALAIKHRLPSISANIRFAEAGGLMSYTANAAEYYRQIAVYVDRIVKGAKPADLPLQRSSRFDLAINMNTAKALRLTIPRPLLTQADRVVE